MMQKKNAQAFNLDVFKLKAWIASPLFGVRNDVLIT